MPPTTVGVSRSACITICNKLGATTHALLHARAYAVRTMCDVYYVCIHACSCGAWERAGYGSIVTAWLEGAAAVNMKAVQKGVWHMHVSTLFSVGRPVTRTRVSRVVPTQWFVLRSVPGIRHRHAHAIVTVERPGPSRPRLSRRIRHCRSCRGHAVIERRDSLSVATSALGSVFANSVNDHANCHTCGSFVRARTVPPVHQATPRETKPDPNRICNVAEV